MMPVERAAEVYAREKCARSFREDLEAHLLNGFVFSQPDFFIMGRPVVSTGEHAKIIDPWHHFPSSECDCWHVYLFAGNMLRAWAILPWELPLFSMERRNELHFHPISVIRRLSGG